MPKKLNPRMHIQDNPDFELLTGVSFTMSGGVVRPVRRKGFLSADILSCGLDAGGRSGREVWAQAGHGRSRCSRARAEQKETRSACNSGSMKARAGREKSCLAGQQDQKPSMRDGSNA